MKNIGCIGCPQLGQLSTRTFPPGLGEFKSHEEAWIRRIQAGQSGEQMLNQLAKNFGGAPFKYYADWTERIAKASCRQADAAARARAQHRCDVVGVGHRSSTCMT